MKLVSLKTDYVFKEVFSRENVRKQFLSDVLGIPMENIRTIRITSSFLLRKPLNDADAVDDWIRLFNAESETVLL